MPSLAVRDDDGVTLRTPQAPRLPLGLFPSFRPVGFTLMEVHRRH